MSGLKQSLKNKLSEKLTDLKDRNFAKAMKSLLDKGIIEFRIDEFGRKIYFIKDEQKAEEFLKNVEVQEP